MLPYLPKRRRIKWWLWAKICLLATAFHLLFLFFLFVIYRGDSFDTSIALKMPIINSRIRIVYMPFQKHAKVIKRSNVEIRSSGGGKQVAQKSKPAISSKLVQKTSLQKTQPKKEVKKTVVQAKSKENKKAIAKKEAPKKVVEKKKEPEKKKEAIAKPPKEQAKEIIKKERLPENPPVKKVVDDQGKKEPAPMLPQEKPKEKEPEILAPEIEQQSLLLPEEVSPEGVPDSDEVVIYMGRYEMEAWHAQQLLQEEIEKVWLQPLGMSPNTSCDIRVLVDWQGKIRDIEILKPSGVRVYDLSARSAAQKTTYPKMFWGKRITITF